MEREQMTPAEWSLSFRKKLTVLLNDFSPLLMERNPVGAQLISYYNQLLTDSYMDEYLAEGVAHFHFQRELNSSGGGWYSILQTQLGFFEHIAHNLLKENELHGRSVFDDAILSFLLVHLSHQSPMRNALLKLSQDQ